MRTRSRGAVHWGAVAALALLAAGCHTAGPQAVRHARVDYNEAMTAGYNEQLLLNLVRLRYRDTPHFLEISGLVTSHVLGASAAASATVGGGSTDVGVSLGGSYEEQPTVIYSPLSGEAFVTRLMTPIQIETLYLLMRSGWSIERVMRCCVRQVNGLLNAPSADGPTPSYTPEFRDFLELTRALRNLQVRHQLRLEAAASGVLDPVSRSGGAADAEGGGGLDGHAGAAAVGGGAGSTAKDGDGEERLDFFLVLQEGSAPERAATAGAATPTAPAGRESPEEALAEAERELLESLGVRPGTLQGGAPGELLLPLRAGVLRSAAEEEGALRLRPRSLLGVFYLLSQGVEVPAEHRRRGLVTVTAEDGRPPEGWSGSCGPPAWEEGLDWPRTVLSDLFAVRTSPDRPDDAFVSVRYRDHWFYVPDCDLQSKSTFALLVQLFALQSGDPKDRASAVLLSLGD